MKVSGFAMRNGLPMHNAGEPAAFAIKKTEPYERLCPINHCISLNLFVVEALLIIITIGCYHAMLNRTL